MAARSNLTAPLPLVASRTRPHIVTQESELTPTGANVLDGRYAVFGYVTEGANLLKEIQVRTRQTWLSSDRRMGLLLGAFCMTKGGNLLKEVQVRFVPSQWMLSRLEVGWRGCLAGEFGISSSPPTLSCSVPLPRYRSCSYFCSVHDKPPPAGGRQDCERQGDGGRAEPGAAQVRPCFTGTRLLK